MKKEELIRETFSWIRVILIALGISFFVNTTLVANAEVPTGSMENTIMPGSRIFVNRLAYLNSDPKRGDIIEFYMPDDGESRYLKRVIALPGEQIQGRDGKIYIDGTELSEPYIKERSYMDFGPYEVPEGAVFLMGDNRNNSWDARYWNCKFVYKEDIIGKAALQYYPKVQVFP